MRLAATSASARDVLRGPRRRRGSSRRSRFVRAPSRVRATIDAIFWNSQAQLGGSLVRRDGFGKGRPQPRRARNMCAARRASAAA